MKDLEKVLDEALILVLDRYHHPTISKRPRFENIQNIQTAAFSFVDESTVINPRFVKKLIDNGLDSLTAITGILTHEFGHYIDNPYDVARLLIQSEAADTYFSEESDEIKKAIVNFYSDISTNLERMRRERTGKELRAVYQKLEEISLPGQHNSFKFINAFYADRVKFFQSNFELTAELEKAMEEMRKIDFLNADYEDINIYSFGQIIIPLLKQDAENAEIGIRKAGISKGGTRGSGKGSEPIFNPFEDTIDGQIEDITDKQIEEALNKIARDKVLNEYERIKKFIAKKRGKIFQKTPTKTKGVPIAGLDSTDFQWHDHLIDFYKRKAEGIGIYVHKRPQIIDAFNSYPLDTTKFKVSDPIHTMNPFSAPGIMPGITQKFKEVPGIIKDKRFAYAHLWLDFDTSGSMQHPLYFSKAVLAGFVLAINYYKNGSQVGINNFSSDSAMLFPTRDLNQVFRMLCGYWGGGTVYDVQKIREYLRNSATAHELQKKGYGGVMISSEEDYINLIKKIDPRAAEKMSRKEVSVKLDRRTQEIYEKLDHVMITDGGIYNLPEVIDYFNATAKHTTHTILVIDNPGFANEARGFGLANTEIFDVQYDNICDIAIGKVKAMNTIEPMRKMF